MVSFPQDYVPWLERDQRIASVVADGDGLLVTIEDEPIRLLVDSAFRRTVAWALVEQLDASEIATAASAALSFNHERFDRDGLVLALHRAQGILILGTSVDGDALEERALLDTLLELRTSIDDARDAFASVPPVPRSAQDSPDWHLIRA